MPNPPLGLPRAEYPAPDDPHAGERAERAEKYAARVREIEDVVGAYGYENSPRERRVERLLRNVSIFPPSS